MLRERADRVRLFCKRCVFTKFSGSRTVSERDSSDDQCFVNKPVGVQQPAQIFAHYQSAYQADRTRFTFEAVLIQIAATNRFLSLLLLASATHE